ncbi:MAG: hypothetical protein E6Q43_02990 [Dokdonella sp.]|nr:MAG: hypothetical protein E6Q43_02990 [Dokdonella sp.]
MKHTTLGLALLALLASSACSQAQSSPEALAKAVQTAFSKGDFDAARKLADIELAPAQLHFFYFDAVRECASESVCSTSTAAADAELITRLKERAAQMNAEAPKVEGTIKIEMKAKDGSSSGKMEMPYAKVGNAYKLVSIAYPPTEIARLKATSSESLLKEFFSKGIRDSKGELRTDWETVATKLPADGGEAGKAFVEQTRKMSAAVDARDPDAAMNSGSQMARMIYRDKGWDDKPIALADRQAKLRVQALRMLRDVKVSGGYQFEDAAVLLIDARDGIGWSVRGPILLTKDGEAWDKAGDNLVSFPASP